jgi:hypothetical protein
VAPAGGLRREKGEGGREKGKTGASLVGRCLCPLPFLSIQVRRGPRGSCARAIETIIAKQARAAIDHAMREALERARRSAIVPSAM